MIDMSEAEESMRNEAKEKKRTRHCGRGDIVVEEESCIVLCRIRGLVCLCRENLLSFWFPWWD